MKLAGWPRVVALVSCLVALGAPGERGARAAEGLGNVESDHLDAFDESERKAAILLNPGGIALGSYGLEADLVLGRAAALSAEAAVGFVPGITAYGAALGVPIFPQSVVLHGFYVHPRAGYALAYGDGTRVSVVGAGATIGWQWTLRLGLSVRLGGGVMVEHTVGGYGENLDGAIPVADGMVGWAF